MSNRYSKNRDPFGPPRSKPEKPTPEFPLFPHANGCWAKKIRGKLHYFGPWADPQAALDLYNQQKDDLHAGRLPRGQEEGALTVLALCTKFLTSKLRQRDAGELAGRSYRDYGDLCKRLQRVFGKNRLVSDLTPADFESLRADMARTWGPVRLGAEIVRARVPFNWAYKSGLLDRPVVFGEGFKKPSKKTLRLERAKRGVQLFEPEEIRRMLAAAPVQLRGMILLGVNCGFGNTDCGRLPVNAIDLERGWVNYPRPKTGIPRRCPLWLETVEALREVLARRKDPKDTEDAGLLFLTKYGTGWTKNEGVGSALTHEMGKLLKALGIARGRGFYALRHCFQTVGDEAGDFLAVRHVMGHAGADIADVYRERISDERLRKVVNFVHDWLFTEPAGQGERAEPDGEEPDVLSMADARRYA